MWEHYDMYECNHNHIITHRVKLITDDSRLTVVTVWESHSSKSTTGKGESLGYSTREKEILPV